MRLEVIFHMKKQRELEINPLNRKLSTIFYIDSYPKNISKHLKNLKKTF